MKNSFKLGGAFAALAVTAFASASVAEVTHDTMPAHPMFAVLHSPHSLHANVRATTLAPNWNFSFTYKGTSYTDAFVGTDPAGGASTTVPVYIIPIKMVYGTTSQSPLATLSNGQTIIANTVASPIFQSTVDFTTGGVDLGTTQYIDAYQRGNLWGTVSTNTGYHVLLGAPTVLAQQTIKVPSSKGSVATEFGVKNVILADINFFDGKAQKLIAKLKIPAGALPIFVTATTYLTSGGCCIGGYHNVSTALGQPYAHFTYIDKSGAFSQNVAALSHEIGEWMLDPNVNNNSPCGIMENGDPLENNANYGDFPYTVGGFTYDLQDLVLLPYFGAPKTTTVNGQSTFQGQTLKVCANGA